MFSCHKHRSVSSKTDEKCAILNQIGDTGSSSCQSGAANQTSSSNYEHCVHCRTRLLTSILTLRCYYCKPGFLRPSMVDEPSGDVALDPKDRLAESSFVCSSCRRTFDSLPFIVKSCDELEELFEFWRHDLATTNRTSSLECMQMYRDQLAKLINEGNIRMVRVSMHLAYGYHTKGDYRRSIEWCHRGIRTMLDYQFEGPDSVTNMFRSLGKMANQMQHVHRGIAGLRQQFAQYFADADKLELQCKNLAIQIGDNSNSGSGEEK